ncbi:PREDICTED: tripartite motif-containing protein 3-like [Branchiostoma belcheri]|uniref:RING-type E3 ubiquitin transferase n=1 Tax=Branchiostoma belcheri TaxID=7741 RepID=A0A6P4XWR7_BRABE|nr:PREDICTED: tripartite motif-containing protein 3-like [Branchiostoma belcheri]
MAAAPSTLGDQIREELSCSICLELFTRPKVLPCQHTFCQDCLQDHAGRGGTFQCPNCRLQVSLPSQGVVGLPDNHLVTSLCERLHNQLTLSGEGKEQPKSGNRCSFHPSEKLMLYCKQCNLPLCSECCEESHDGHPTTGLKKAIKQQRAPVQALISEGRDILETYLSFLRGLRQTEKSLNEQKQQTDNSIIQAYTKRKDVLAQKLTESKDHLLSETEKQHGKNIKLVQDERDRVLADVSELSAACDQAEQDMEQRAIQFLSQQTRMTEVVGKYRGKAAPTPVQTQPAVFQPTDTPVPVLGHVMVQSLPSTPILEETENGQKRDEKDDDQTQRGMFEEVKGVAVSEEGEIFVLEQSFPDERIQVFTLQGKFVREFPTAVPGNCEMRPDDVAMDREGNLWVVGGTDSAEFAVQYNKQGRVLRKFDLQKTGCFRGVAVDTRRNHILISQTTGDEDNLHVQGEVLVFTPDGTLVRTVGQQQGMKYPRYITVDREGNILVSDHCVYVYNEDGQFVFQFGDMGYGEGHLSGPRGICTDRAGNIIVADSGHDRVEMFDQDRQIPQTHCY